MLMSGWYIFKTDRKTSIKAARFILGLVFVSALLAVFFPKINKIQSKDKLSTDSTIVR
jgi:hypothetical protein